MNKNFKVKLILGIILSILAFSCKKNENVIPTFAEIQIFDPPSTYMYLTAGLLDEESIIHLIEDHGFIWALSPNVTFENAEIVRLGKRQPNTSFFFRLENLKGNTTYYYKAFVQINGQQYLDKELTFTTRPGTWKKLSDFPGGGLVNATGFSINGRGYVVGENKVWEYNPDNDSWIQKKDAPFTTEGPTSFSVSNEGYVYCSDLWKYLPQTDNWLKIPTSDDRFLSKGCGGVSSFVIDNKAYIGGGSGNFGESWIEFEPISRSWQVADFNSHLAHNRSYASSFAIGKKGYLVGGDTYISRTDYSVAEFDFENGTSRYREPFKTDRGIGALRKEMTYFSINGQGFAGMGYGERPTGIGFSIGSQSDFYRYDEINDSWVPQPIHVHINENNELKFLGRAGAVSIVIGNRAFIGLGELRDFDSETETWTRTPYTDFWEFIPD